MTEIYDWSRTPRALLEELAHESVTYWHTPGPGPKPMGTGVCRALDAVCKAARRLRTRAEIDTEIANLVRERATMPRPYDLDEVSRIAKRIELLCREPTAEASPPGDELAAGGACEGCRDLRARLRNIYHLTLTYSSAAATIQAIREASAPGAPAPPAPPASGDGICAIHGPCPDCNRGVDP